MSRKRLLTDEKIIQAHKAYMNGQSIASLADELYISPDVLRKYFHQLSLEVRQRYVKKFSDEEVKQAYYEVYQNGKSSYKAAESIGMNQGYFTKKCKKLGLKLRAPRNRKVG